jgi:predicted alpha/beta superfamily hydrolase
VLYLHDGQNLFDAATAFLGNEWGLGRTADELIGGGRIQPLIIVGIYNAGVHRLAEYTPEKDRRGRGGRAWLYGKLLVQDLKPFIDSHYRTAADPDNTGVGGSSLGGLLSLYLGLEYPDAFRKLVVMSPSVWWANRAILKRVAKLKDRTGQKIWLDVGTAEDSHPGGTHLPNVIDLRDALCAKGWRLGDDLTFVQDEGAGHNERAWGHRMRAALEFLFPARP